jgi:hypothetical protein
MILFDCGYPSFDLIKELLGKKIHFVMRVHEKFSTGIDELCYGDHEIEIERGEEKIKVRVIKFWLENGEEETLITDVLDKKIWDKEFQGGILQTLANSDKIRWNKEQA